MNQKVAQQLASGSFDEEGLYLIWPDEEPLALTHKKIQAVVDDYLKDPQRLPQEVKSAVEFAPCSICPKRDTAEICHAIMPALPFIEKTDDFYSHQSVVAVYREHPDAPIQIKETTMQQALMYVTILSLTQYCEVGQTYSAYFEGVNPLMGPEHIAKIIFKNLYLEEQGNLESIQKIVTKMERELQTTSHCQIARLRLICKKDAFCNAFVNTQSATSWLIFQLEDHIEQLASKTATT